jgi:hypothetical protein
MPAVGCFDVDGGGAAPLLIDNFDNGTVLPVDRHFDQWRCQTFNTSNALDCNCGYDDGTYRSYPYSLYLRDAVISDSFNGGAQVYTLADVPVDLSHMHEVAFSFKFDKLHSAISGDAILYVELYCSLCSDPVQVTPRVQHGWKFGQVDGWQTFVVELSEDNFKVPNNLANGGIVGGLAACLERVDGIHVSVNAGLPDGGNGILSFNVDDVYFR